VDIRVHFRVHLETSNAKRERASGNEPKRGYVACCWNPLYLLTVSALGY
jgi:hypothetical protein